MDDEDKVDINIAKEVGALSFKALMNAKSLVKPGAKLLDVAEKAEKFVLDAGLSCAFPINLSINSEAAHYTPSFLDEKVFGEKDVVKIDFGAAKDGVLGDCAVTVDLSGEQPKLVEATEEALKNAIATVKSGRKVSEIGAVIQKAIESKGFLPVKNLGGHGVGLHNLHTDPFIPNYDNGDDTELEEGMIVAIEPFATTDSKGMIYESDVCEIYELGGNYPVRNPYARKELEEIVKRYESEPFAVRWLSDVAKERFGLYAGILELSRSGCINPHPTLVSIGGGLISQAEAQVTVTKDGCEVLTKQ